GQSVVYSASWVGSSEELFVTRPQSPVSRALDLGSALILSISNSGDMAILLNPQFSVGWQRIGTLATAPIDGGAPRQIMNDIQDADWAPDGKTLAVSHASNGRYLLEYPPGKVLYSTTSWFNNVRISPNGDFVAFMDHPQGGDDRGTVAFVDLKGNVKQLTSDYASESGLHWSPDGTEIWYTASIEGSNEQTLY